MLLLGGWFIAERLNKLPTVLAFGAAYVGLWTATAFVSPGMAAEMFRPPFLQAALFLAFFMLTDPPTSPNRYREQVTYGTLAAAGSFAATLLGAGQLYLLVGTLLANLWLAIHRWLRQRRARGAIVTGDSAPIGPRSLVPSGADVAAARGAIHRAA